MFHLTYLCNKQVLSNDKRVFFFLLFESTGAYRQILEIGLWHFGGKLMILQQWYPQMEFNHNLLTNKHKLEYV